MCSATSFSSARRLGLEGAVFGFVGRAFAGAGNGAVLYLAVFDADEQLGRCANDVRLLASDGEAQEEHVGAGIDDAKSAVDVEGGNLGQAVETLRKHALEDVAGRDVLLDTAHGREEIRPGGARDQLERGAGRLGSGWVRLGWQRAIEHGFQPVQALQGGRVGVAASQVGGADEQDFVADVIHGENLIEEHQVRVGCVQLIGGGAGQALDQADDVVGEEADRARGEGRQAGQGGGGVARQRGLQAVEKVAIVDGGFAGLDGR